MFKVIRAEFETQLKRKLSVSDLTVVVSTTADMTIQ